MFVKTKSFKRPLFHRVISYIMNESKRMDDFVLTHNLKGNSIAAWTREFNENELYRLRKRTNSVYFNHDTISWHPKDAGQLTVEKIEAMLREYIRLRNPNGIFLASIHTDKKHIHAHVMVSGIEYRSGKTMRISKAELGQIKVRLQEFQRELFPELEYSIVEHMKDTRSLIRKDIETIKGILQRIQKESRTIEIFLSKMEREGLEVYYRGGKPYGIRLEKRKYRFRRIDFNLEIEGNNSKEKSRTIHKKVKQSPKR